MKSSIKNFFGVKKLFKKAFKKKSGETIRPIRAWTIGLSFAVVVFCIGIGFTAFDFYTQLVSEPEITAEEKVLIYRQDEVREYDSFFNEREASFNALRLNREVPTPIVEEELDPLAQEEGEDDDIEDDNLEVTSQ